MPNYGSWTFNKVQLGREATAGSPVAATTIWRGPFADIADTRQRERAEEQVGLFTNEERLYDTRLGATWAQAETELTFEQLPHIFEAGIKTVTASGTAAPYTYTYAFPTGETLNTIKTYTIEAGNVIATGDVREMEYAFVSQFTISGVQGEAWKMSSTWMGRQVTPGVSFTSSLSLPAVEEAIFANTSLYIDASEGSFGGTQKSGVLQSFSVDVTTGIEGKFTGDGVLYFNAHAFRKPEITFNLAMQLEDSNLAETERDAFETKAIRLLQLVCTGSSNRSFTIKSPVRYLSVDPYEDSDGNTVVPIQGYFLYSGADTAFATFIVANALSSLP